MTEEEHQQAIKALTNQYEARLREERLLGDIGRSVVGALKERGCLISYVPKAGDGSASLCAKYARMGKDFDTLLTAVKNDVMLTSEWDRFSMMLRLAQED